uniref:UspA domain-containing protein n=1 Tax=Paramoeba aestuarina TaxID=180227 RepID=A0A7S4USH7_9EUKA|eukprot:CAMPEP_0201508302 /NCGR_PEP_ID=MMETSP0161_2-20130828/1713_1 /ASSEMBLY_ACC=CAM_ASM_000251 /TAXON_ID=180227 /ORGANISM="Neoparamoeba aestuarina, Strain SoJaBio B1-5/56/2" /LENGTH=230 /DNA_ID=CAMNT_0047902931 /DNA_START=22 /DNA_END=714 /DNA_ORIENTATION=+
MASGGAAKHFLVAIDDSENSGWAFDYTVAVMDRKIDVLHLMTVVHDPAPVMTPFGDPDYAHEMMLKAKAAEKEKCKNRLRYFAHLCHQLEIQQPLRMTLGSGHIGDIICAYVKENKVNFLVMGRRGLGTVQRLFLGSSSKFCIEEADCNVIIIKRPYALEVVHDSTKQEAIDAEEAERRWRIEEYEKQLQKEKEDSQKDLEECKKMEEEERKRRESEDQPGRSVSGRAQD